jgi:hypothetical protein
MTTFSAMRTILFVPTVDFHSVTGIPLAMAESRRTKGEIVFEDYLNFQGIPFDFEKEHPGKSKRPDYAIEWEGKTIVFDVKDFDPPDAPLSGFGAFDPYPPIREKIDQGRDKFKQFKEYCCGLVLFDAGRPLLLLDSPDVMLGSMYGDSGFSFPVNTTTGIGEASQTKQKFLGRGKMIRPNWSQAQNTTLSAIIVVSMIKPFLIEMTDLMVENPGIDIEAEMRQRIPNFNPDIDIPRVVVWYNGVARIPFPSTLFRGDYDTHYGIVRAEDGVIEQGVTYEGSAVPDRIKLSKRRKAR